MGKSLFLMLVILPLLIIPAYGESHVEISVTTDKSEYVENDTIIITGSVSEILNSTSVIIQIIHNASYAHLAQLPVASDGIFTEMVLAGGMLWKEPGEYTVRAQYEGHIGETTFYYWESLYTEPQFPLILEENHIKKVTKEMDRWEDILNQADIDINQTMADLDEAILENATDQIALRSEHIGSLIALKEIFETLIITLHQQMEIYS